MKEEKHIVALDTYEEGAVITALMDMRNKELAENENADFTSDLILKVMNAPTKKVRVFQQLFYSADHKHGGSLPVHVHMLMDEFANATQFYR